MSNKNHENPMPEEELWSALDGWQPEPVSLDFNRRLFQQIDAIEARRRRFVRMASLVPVVVVLALAGLLYSPFTSQPSDEPSPAAVVALEAPDSQNKAVVQTLSDIEMLQMIHSTKSL